MCVCVCVCVCVHYIKLFICGAAYTICIKIKVFKPTIKTFYFFMCWKGSS